MDKPKKTDTIDVDNRNACDEWLYQYASGSQDSDIDSDQQAEYQLIHALLCDVALTDSARNQVNERRVERVMKRINPPKKALPWAPIWAVAATFVGVAILFLTMVPQTPTAQAEMEKVRVAMSSLMDRHYQVTVVNVDEPKPVAQAGKRRRYFKGGELYLRAPNNYLLKQFIDKGRVKLLGNNGVDSWTLNHHGKLKLFPPSVIKLPFTSQSADVVITDVVDNIARFQTGYTLTLTQEQQIEGIAKPLSVIDAQRVERHGMTDNANKKGVKHVVIYYDPDTFIIQRIILHNTHMQGRKERKTVIFNLLSTTPLPNDWFDYKKHLENYSDQ